MAKAPYTPLEVAIDLPNCVDGHTIMRRKAVCSSDTVNSETRTVKLEITERFYSIMPDGSCGKEWETLRIQRPLQADNFSIVNAAGTRIGRKGNKAPEAWAAELAALDLAGVTYMGQGDYFLKIHDTTAVVIRALKLQYMTAEFLPPAP